jgi:6,7-dimethyl-8-ribityllumazine synthase
MSSSQHNIPNTDELPDASDMRFGIVVSQWNSEITEALYESAFKTLISAKANTENICRINVPGSFELPLGALSLYAPGKIDALICLGCVIQGETRHFEFICNAVSQGLMNLSLKYAIPFVFGVLTTNTIEQARERAGGKHGNKGTEAAMTAIKMVAVQKELRK